MDQLTDFSQFNKYVKFGILSFDQLDHEQNGLPLCPSCHRAFDDLNNPGMIFLPVDLDYFIDFEVKDYNSREEIATTTGDVLPRMVPDPEGYSKHLKEEETWQAMLSPEADGGLYWRYTLRDYFPTLMNTDKSFIPGLGPSKKPGVWHGAPMAALRRAFQVLGDPTVEGIPEEQLKQLWELRKLYARKLAPADLAESSAAGQIAVPIRESEQEQSGLAPLATQATNSSVHRGLGVPAIVSGRRSNNQRQGHNAPHTDVMRPALESAIARSARSTQLVRFGRGASTEINIRRYMTMMMPLSP
jgi:hypothetical protein